MENQPTLRETKKHGAAWFLFNIYPCAIPLDFTQVALHWQDSMELVFVKKGRGIVQAGLTSYTAAAGDIYVFAPGVLHALLEKRLHGDVSDRRQVEKAVAALQRRGFGWNEIRQALADYGDSLPEDEISP